MNMGDHFTYLDLSGKRRLRRYVVATIIIFILIGGIFIWAGVLRAQTRALMEQPFATLQPQADQQAVIPATIAASPTLEVVLVQPTASPTLEVVLVQPTASPTLEVVLVQPTTSPIPDPLPTKSNCPTDPDSWAFLDNYYNDHYKFIVPDCVYEGVARTVAWQMLETSLGYNKPEATELLGFEADPWRPTQEIVGLTNTKGPMLLGTSMETAYPDYYRWQVDADGDPALIYTMRGCYRTQEDWGTGYPVLCVVTRDSPPRWSVHKYGQHHQVSIDLTDQLWVREWILFGYAGNGLWVLVGDWKDLIYDIEDPDRTQVDRETYARRFDTGPWDAYWLEAEYGLTMRPLPSGWQTHSDPSVFQAMVQTMKDEAHKSRMNHPYVLALTEAAP